MLAWVLWVVGAFVCLLNAYLSFLRYPVHRLLGRSADSYRFVSGFPWIGSLLVALAWGGGIREAESSFLDIATWVLVVVDTGGIHWFLGVMTHEWLAERFKRTG